MVLEDGRWLLASFQLAPSIFDNPLVERAAQALYWGAAAALVGLVAGLALGRRRRRRA